MISPLLVCTPLSIPLCLFDSLKCHLNTEYSLPLSPSPSCSPSLPKSSCHFVHLLSPNMVNRAGLQHRSSRGRVCSCRVVDKHLSLGHGAAKPIFTAHLSPLWLQPKTCVWKSQGEIISHGCFIHWLTISRKKKLQHTSRQFIWQINLDPMEWKRQSWDTIWEQEKAEFTQ